jgi:hypothetical protein
MFRTLLVLVVAGGLTAAVPAAPAANAAAELSTGTASSSLAAAFAHGINAERVAAGRRPLAVDSVLAAGALAWSRHMAGASTLAHNPHLAGIVRHWRYLGENVGVGYSVGSLADAFWHSAEHRSNILDRHYNRVGVGVVVVGSKIWVTEDFLGDGRSSTTAVTQRRATAAHRTTGVAAGHTARPVAIPVRPPRHRSLDRFVLACRHHALARFGIHHERFGQVGWPTALSACAAGG